MVRFTEKTITGKNRLNKELNRIGKQGYALDDQEKETGVRCIAAAISISGAIQWIEDKQITPLSEFVIGTANAISSELGYHG